jgi:transcriptional regulator of acetoin/glycerol metabolism
MYHSDALLWLHEAKLGTNEVILDPEPSSPHLDDSDRAILTAQEANSFSSVRELARAIHIHRATIYRRLTKSLWFVQHLLRWLPNFLSDTRKMEAC